MLHQVTYYERWNNQRPKLLWLQCKECVGIGDSSQFGDTERTGAGGDRTGKSDERQAQAELPRRDCQVTTIREGSMQHWDDEEERCYEGTKWGVVKLQQLPAKGKGEVGGDGEGNADNVSEMGSPTEGESFWQRHRQGC